MPPPNNETLIRRIGEPERRIIDLRCELAERDEDLAAARATNRDSVAHLNR